jgi:NADH-quinone oxidoreductase subunit F
MPQVNRVLDADVVPDLDTYLANGGGRGLEAAARVEPVALIDVVQEAGLRGRGGAGFPTAVKWRTVAENRSPTDPTAVIVNAAEGEPGTFKDRAILRTNPYRVLEGALIAARAVGAPEIVVAAKASFTREIARLRQAISELEARGLSDISFRVVEGPSEYLFGEESALLEVVEGRYPFPRVTPPYRRGLEQRDASGNSSAWVGLAVAGGAANGPALVDNVETLANVPGIVADGPAWFRSVGTDQSPGTIVCTITGATPRHGVGEFAMGTPLWEVIEAIGGGPHEGRTLIAAMSGTANAALTADQFDTGLSYEAMTAAGSGLGTGGFIVFDDDTDLVAVAHAISRFLAIESCGQCQPCKDDGLRIAEHLDAIRRSSATPRELGAIDLRLGTVADGARCALAAQQQSAVGSLLRLGRVSIRAHIGGELEAAPAELVAPIVDIVDGRAILDETHLAKQPDWTMHDVDSGAPPAELYGDESLDVDVTTSEDDMRARAGDRWSPGESEDGDAGDPFESVRRRHARLRADLGRARTIDADERRDALAELDQHLREYLDLTGRVLYPMLSRATFSTGDDVAWAAQHDAQRAQRLSERLTSDGDDPRTFGALADEIDELVRCDEQVALPLLRRILDREQLDNLADALDEVAEMPRQPTAAARFGTSPR